MRVGSRTSPRLRLCRTSSALAPPPGCGPTSAGQPIARTADTSAGAGCPRAAHPTRTVWPTPHGPAGRSAAGGTERPEGERAVISEGAENDRAGHDFSVACSARSASADTPSRRADRPAGWCSAATSQASSTAASRESRSLCFVPASQMVQTSQAPPLAPRYPPLVNDHIEVLVWLAHQGDSTGWLSSASPRTPWSATRPW